MLPAPRFFFARGAFVGQPCRAKSAASDQLAEDCRSAAEFAIDSERRRDQAVRLHLGRAALTASATSSCGPVMAAGLDGAGAGRRLQSLHQWPEKVLVVAPALDRGPIDRLATWTELAAFTLPLGLVVQQLLN
jgi:hypothetical protein